MFADFTIEKPYEVLEVLENAPAGMMFVALNLNTNREEAVQLDLEDIKNLISYLQEYVDLHDNVLAMEQG